MVRLRQRPPMTRNLWWPVVAGFFGGEGKVFSYFQGTSDTITPF